MENKDMSNGKKYGLFFILMGGKMGLQKAILEE